MAKKLPSDASPEREASVRERQDIVRRNLTGFNPLNREEAVQRDKVARTHSKQPGDIELKESGEHRGGGHARHEKGKW